MKTKTIKLNGFNSRLREEATCGIFARRRRPQRFNSRLREEATRKGVDLMSLARVSTHASVRRRLRNSQARPSATRFQLTPP